MFQLPGLESMLDSEEMEVANGLRELGKEVDVAVSACLVARDGAKDRERPDAERAEVVPVGPDELERVGTAHESIIGLPIAGRHAGASQRTSVGSGS